MKHAKKMLLLLLAASLLALITVATSACGAPEAKCSPACATGEVCFAEDGTTYQCKKSCTSNDDCTSPLVCHTDETPAHCGDLG